MKKDNQFLDEEYQFPDFGENLEMEQPEEEVSTKEETQPEPDPKSAPSKSGLSEIWGKHKRVIIVIGVVVVVAIAFTWMRASHHTAEPVVAPPAPAPVVQPVIDPQMVQQMDNLKQESANNSTAIRQLQGQVQQLTGALNDSKSSQQQLNQSLLALVGQLQQMNTEVKLLANPPKPVKVAAPVPVTVAVPVITFQLRAVVPGRAWIVGSDGQSLSVAVGDHVTQYGNVQSIDADAGVVITTSGKTIKF